MWGITQDCQDLSDGKAEIDNLIAERALRAVAIVRHNSLFAAADSAHERAVAIYSLVGTANLNGIDPEAYLRFVLTRVANHATSRIDELTRWVATDPLRTAFRKSRSPAKPTLALRLPITHVSRY
jgi:transposase